MGHHDPNGVQPPSKIEQGPAKPPPGPVPPEILQWPKTASSGRRLIIVNCGGSYGFLVSAGFNP